MAEKLTPESAALVKAQEHLGGEAPPPAGHNNGTAGGDPPRESDGKEKKLTPKQRRTLIRETAQALDKLDSEIKGLQEKRTEIKNVNIKGKLGMKVSDWNWARRSTSLEGEDKDQFLTTCNEIYGALTKGGQLDLVDVLTKSSEADSDPDAEAFRDQP